MSAPHSTAGENKHASHRVTKSRKGPIGSRGKANKAPEPSKDASEEITNADWYFSVTGTERGSTVNVTLHTRSKPFFLRMDCNVIPKVTSYGGYHIPTGQTVTSYTAFTGESKGKTLKSLTPRKWEDEATSPSGMREVSADLYTIAELARMRSTLTGLNRAIDSKSTTYEGGQIVKLDEHLHALKCLPQSEWVLASKLQSAINGGSDGRLSIQGCGPPELWTASPATSFPPQEEQRSATHSPSDLGFVTCFLTSDQLEDLQEDPSGQGGESSA
jgi:hypothetical protein